MHFFFPASTVLLVHCRTSIGVLSMGGTDLIVVGADVRVRGDLDCSGGDCPDPSETEKGALFSTKQKEICPGTKGVTTTTTTTTLMG